MLKLLKTLPLIVLFVLTAFGSNPKVGERAPRFSLPASDGRVVALNDYTGRRLVLVFYRGYW